MRCFNCNTDNRWVTDTHCCKCGDYLYIKAGRSQPEAFVAAPGSANNGESKWAWMMKWCKKNGLAPATVTVWELAEKRWLEANSPNESSSATTRASQTQPEKMQP